MAAARESGRTGDHRDQAHLGLPGVRLHRAGTRGAAEGEQDGQPVYEVVRFREKPNAGAGGAISEAGEFPLERRDVHLAAERDPLARSSATRRELAQFRGGSCTRARISRRSLAERFPSCRRSRSITRSWRKPERVLVVEAGFDWDDVGSWTAVAKYLRHDADENAANTERLTTQDAAGNIVYTTRPGHVALMGVRDLIVVQTEDALLVAHRSEAEKIKQLVGKVPPELQ